MSLPSDKKVTNVKIFVIKSHKPMVLITQQNKN